MRAIQMSPSFAEALQAEGVTLPDECRDVRIGLPVDGVVCVEYSCNLTPDLMEKFGRAFGRMVAPLPDDVRRLPMGVFGQPIAASQADGHADGRSE